MNLSTRVTAMRGILVAFLARQNPTRLHPHFGPARRLLLASGGISMQRNHQLPDATILVFQGIVFLTILFSTKASTAAGNFFRRAPGMSIAEETGHPFRWKKGNRNL